MSRTLSELAWACMFVALLATIVIAFTRPAKVEPSPPVEPAPIDLRVNLDLTETALSACLTAFIRYGLGGPVSDYECRVDGPVVALYGPSWHKYQSHADGKPPTAKLGAVRMEVAAK